MLEYLETDPLVKSRKGWGIGKGTYLGQRHRWNLQEGFFEFFNSGGAGYILDEYALKALVRNININACLDGYNLTFTQADQNVANCLHASYITPLDTRDSLKAHRFHQSYLKALSLEGARNYQDMDISLIDGTSIGLEFFSSNTITLHKIHNARMMFFLDFHFYGCGHSDAEKKFPDQWFNEYMEGMHQSEGPNHSQEFLQLLYKVPITSKDGQVDLNVYYGDTWEMLNVEILSKLGLTTFRGLVDTLHIIIETTLTRYRDILEQPLLEAGLEVFLDPQFAVADELRFVIDQRYCLFFGLELHDSLCLELRHEVLREVWETFRNVTHV